MASEIKNILNLVDSLQVKGFEKKHLPIGNLPKPEDEKKLTEACKNFETLLTQRMLNEMFKSTDLSSQFGAGAGGDFFAEMYTGNIAKEAADNNNFGLAEQMLKQIQSRNNINPADILKIRELSGLDRISTNHFVKKEQLPKTDSVNLLEKFTAPHSLSPDKISRYDSIIDIQSEKQGVDSALIKAVIKNESNGNHKAVSSAGAKGLMQLMDSTAADLGVDNSFHPEQNIAGGTKYLKMMLEKYDNNLPKAIAAYNAGPGNVDKYKGIPPFAETQAYVKRVMHDFKKYSQMPDLSSNNEE